MEREREYSCYQAVEVKKAKFEKQDNEWPV
jgi:hypothetical protein